MANSPQGATVDIEDIVQLCKNRYPGNLEMQGRYIQVAVDLIKRDYAENVTTISFEWEGLDGEMIGFPSSGVIYFFWRLSKYGDVKAIGLERVHPETKVSKMLFYSNVEYSTSLLSRMNAMFK